MRAVIFLDSLMTCTQSWLVGLAPKRFPTALCPLPRTPRCPLHRLHRFFQPGTGCLLRSVVSTADIWVVQPEVLRYVVGLSASKIRVSTLLLSATKRILSVATFGGKMSDLPPRNWDGLQGGGRVNISREEFLKLVSAWQNSSRLSSTLC